MPKKRNRRSATTADDVHDDSAGRIIPAPPAPAVVVGAISVQIDGAVSVRIVSPEPIRFAMTLEVRSDG